MDEFTMSAFALYPDGRGGDAFAEVSAASLRSCFAEMADEVAVWLPRAIARAEGPGAPRAIELTLEWSAAGAPEPAAEPPPAEDDPAGEPPPRPARPLRCAARRHHRSGARIGFAAPALLRGAPA